MIETIVRIVREMLPSTDLVIRSVIRAAIGGAVLIAAQAMPAWAGHWIEFAGKFMVMLAIIGLIGHSEGVFTKHVVAKLRALFRGARSEERELAALRAHGPAIHEGL